MNRSIVQRAKHLEKYEKTIAEAEARYGELVNTSTLLVNALKDTAEFLDESAGNKKVGPDHLTPEQEETVKKYIHETIILPAEVVATFIIDASTQV